MRCDDVRQSVTEGAPLDEAARGHLAACEACGGEFPELVALTSARTVPPPSLRDRVLSGFPSRRASPWPGLARAAATLLIGLIGGFAGGYAAKTPQIVKEKEVVQVEAPPSDDVISNIGIAAQAVYRGKVQVDFDDRIHVVSITIDPEVKNWAKYCPVAREIVSLAEARPDIVFYKKKEY